MRGGFCGNRCNTVMNEILLRLSPTSSRWRNALPKSRQMNQGHMCPFLLTML